MLKQFSHCCNNKGVLQLLVLPLPTASSSSLDEKDFSSLNKRKILKLPSATCNKLVEVSIWHAFFF